MKTKKLVKGTVDVWHLSLDLDSVQLDELKGLLSQDELARAAKLKIMEKKERFIARRGLLRKILSLYTGINPELLVFEYLGNGKPSIKDLDGLHFNISHCGDMMLCAVALDPVGIDIEKISDIDIKNAAQYFSGQELNRISDLPEQEQKKAFFRLWTQKEAVAKAKADSISCLLSRDLATLDTSDIDIVDLDIKYPDSLIAAVAVQSKDRRYRIDIRNIECKSIGTLAH